LLALPSLALTLSAVFFHPSCTPRTFLPHIRSPIASSGSFLPAQGIYLSSVYHRRQAGHADEVKERLAGYPPSAEEYTIVRHNITAAWITFGGFAVSSFAAVIEYAHNNKHAGETTGLVNGQPGFIYQQHSLTGAYILTGVAAGFLTSAIVTFVTAKNHARKALKVYNQRFE
jgi:ABC-type Fe3+-siderophore transport system permease subunit